MRNDPQRFNREALGRRDACGLPLGELLAAIIEWLAHPIELDDLVGVTATLLGITDRHARAEVEEAGSASGGLSLPVLEERIDRRSYLRRLWAEICLLPERQRAAILLNLKDEQGNNAAALFPLTGAASLRQIAAALLLSGESLAELRNDLPFDDKRIASHLGVTRQQVINLRKSARERLARRMQGFGWDNR